MRTGLSLQEMAKELERQKDQKRDFIAPTKELEMELDQEVLKDHKDGAHVVDATTFRVNGHGEYLVSETAHDQLANRLGIPKKYYDRMLAEQPALLAQNVNTWLHEQPEKRMVRTLDGRMRAFLSSRYRPLDNEDLAETVLPLLIKNGVRIESSDLTERHLYIKAVTERVSFEVKKGDIVQAGIVISNSEVGCGSVKIEPMIFRLVCLNGMIAPDYSLSKYHVGRNTGDGDLAEEFYRDETRRADDRAFWMKVRDVVTGAFDNAAFQKIVHRMRDAIDAEIVASPDKVVEVVQNKFQLTDDERGGILKYLIKGADLSQYGLVNAVTRYSQDIPDYERATDLERLGGQVLELPKHDWDVISNGEAN